MEGTPLRPHEIGVSVEVWVVPGAGRTEIAGVHDGAIRIRVAAPPERGEANRAVSQVLEAATGVRATLVRGHGARRKVYVLEGIDVDKAAARLLDGAV